MWWQWLVQMQAIASKKRKYFFGKNEQKNWMEDMFRVVYWISGKALYFIKYLQV